MRKVVQIVVYQETEHDFGAIFSLCDDGTMWVAEMNGDIVWEQVKGVPQDEDEKDG